MLNKKFYKGVVNKVVCGDRIFMRVFHIDEKSDGSNELLNLRIFEEIEEGRYIPFHTDENTDPYIIDRLLTPDSIEDVVIDIDEINLFLDSVVDYTEKTLDIVSNTVKSISPGAEVLIYKEYMCVYYTVVLDNDLAKLFEIKILSEDKMSFTYVEDKLVSKILIEDFSNYINEELELYVKVADDKYIVLTNVNGKRCSLEVVVHDNEEENLENEEYDLSFDLNAMHFSSTFTQDDIEEALSVARFKMEKVADLFEMENKNKK